MMPKMQEGTILRSIAKLPDGNLAFFVGEDDMNPNVPVDPAAHPDLTPGTLLCVSRENPFVVSGVKMIWVVE
jgi:hypothetical protein